MKKEKYLVPEVEALAISPDAALLQNLADLQKQTVTWGWDNEDEE